MSNASIAKRILEAIKGFEAGKLSASAIAESIELHEPALESVDRRVRDKLHELSVQALEQDLTPFEEETLGLQASRNAVNALKELLASIK